jgi:hypothetical protein
LIYPVKFVVSQMSELVIPVLRPVRTGDIWQCFMLGHDVMLNEPDSARLELRVRALALHFQTVDADALHFVYTDSIVVYAFLSPLSPNPTG